eukprot:s772_g9.t1
MSQDDPTRLALVQAWVESTLEAWAVGAVDTLAKSLSAAERLVVSKGILHRTGAGFLLHSDLIWCQFDSRWQQRRHRLLSTWKRMVQQDKEPLQGACKSPFHGLKPQGFKDAFDALLQEIQDDPANVPTSFEHRAVFILMAKGFLHISHLEGLYPEQVYDWTDLPRVQCILRMAVQRANDSSRTRRKRTFLESRGEPDNVVAAAADGLALELTAAATVLDKPFVMEQGPAKTLAELMAMSSESAQSDIVHFVAIFRNAGTAANYISYIKWACVLRGYSLQWFTGQVTMALKGLKKQANRDGKLVEQKIFDEDIVLKVITLCNGLPNHFAIGAIFLLAWQFLLRGPSEAVPAEWGSEQELYQLPPGRHSALWVDSQGVTSLRLRRRKNRPQGSLLRRPCLCSTVPNPMCLGHRILSAPDHIAVGQSVCQLTASQLLYRLHRLLAMLLVADPCNYKWKAFRAGKASAMAKAGQPLPQILQAGEWRSAAVLNYVPTCDPDKDLVASLPMPRFAERDIFRRYI